MKIIYISGWSLVEETARGFDIKERKSWGNNVSLDSAFNSNNPVNTHCGRLTLGNTLHRLWFIHTVIRQAESVTVLTHSHTEK